ncbi:hypothetical protein NL676_008894 [Syzygium grande]|nr:hypothetical protein NL676_008894 [Syzygium grande]
MTHTGRTPCSPSLSLSLSLPRHFQRRSCGGSDSGRLRSPVTPKPSRWDGPRRPSRRRLRVRGYVLGCLSC